MYRFLTDEDEERFKNATSPEFKKFVEENNEFNSLGLGEYNPAILFGRDKTRPQWGDRVPLQINTRQVTPEEAQREKEAYQALKKQGVTDWNPWIANSDAWEEKSIYEPDYQAMQQSIPILQDNLAAGFGSKETLENQKARQDYYLNQILNKTQQLHDDQNKEAFFLRQQSDEALGKNGDTMGKLQARLGMQNAVQSFGRGTNVLTPTNALNASNVALNGGSNFLSGADVSNIQQSEMAKLSALDNVAKRLQASNARTSAAQQAARELGFNSQRRGEALAGDAYKQIYGRYMNAAERNQMSEYDKQLIKQKRDAAITRAALSIFGTVMGAAVSGGSPVGAIVGGATGAAAAEGVNAASHRSVKAPEMLNPNDLIKKDTSNNLYSKLSDTGQINKKIQSDQINNSIKKDWKT